MWRIFGIVASISTLMIMTVGGCIYWFASADADDAKREAVSAIVHNAVNNLAQQIEILQKSVDGVAQSPDVIAALNSANPDIIRSTEAKLQTTVPHNLRLRLLLPSINDLDESQTPRMGFGDLDMIRATLTGQPSPAIQGNADDRHLAITSAVRNGDSVVGVVLASLDANLPKQILARIQLTDGFIELKQDQLLLATAGNADSKSGDPVSIPIANSRWKIESWTSTGASVGDAAILATLIILPILISCLAYFIGYRKLVEYFREDQSSILKAAKDMMQGKHVGNYPMRLEELQPIVTAMAQFKRVISQDNIDALASKTSDKDDLFEESFDLDFLEDTAPISVAVTPIQVPDNPINPITDTAPHAKKLEEAMLPDSWDMASSIKLAETFDNTNIGQASPSSSASPNIFHQHDIGGLLGKGIDEDTFDKIGRAFASEARQHNVKTIVLGRDGRTSSSALAQALIRGIVSTGCDVLDLGIIPTPLLRFVTHHVEGKTGVMVTGSQLPADYNGLKMILHDEPLSAEQIQSLKTRIARQDFSHTQPGSVEQNSAFNNEYIGIISEKTHIVRPMTVVLDCGNGATGQLAPILLKTVGCDVIELNCEIDGTFPGHQPDPSNPDNLAALTKAVKLNNAEVGIAFDGDGDRMGLVDSSGNIIWPDKLMMLFARDVLATKPGSEIIFDTACSKHLAEQIKKHGGRPIPWKSGATNLQTRLQETSASMAADISGHFLFHDRWFGFPDALYAAVRMIEILSADMRSSSEVFADLPDSFTTAILHVPLHQGDGLDFIEQMRTQADFNDAYITSTDGMQVEFPDGWGCIRAVSLPPSLVLRFEADNRDALRHVQAQFKTAMLKIKPDLLIPF